MTTRTDSVKMLSENRDVLEANLHEVWRRQAEDLVAAGLDPKDVVETMISVSITQGIKAGYLMPRLPHPRSCFF